MQIYGIHLDVHCMRPAELWPLRQRAWIGPLRETKAGTPYLHGHQRIVSLLVRKCKMKEDKTKTTSYSFFNRRKGFSKI